MQYSYGIEQYTEITTAEEEPTGGGNYTAAFLGFSILTTNVRDIYNPALLLHLGSFDFAH